MNFLNQTEPILIYVRAMHVPRLASVSAVNASMSTNDLREVTLVQTADKFVDVSPETFVRRSAEHKKLKPALVLGFVVELVRWETCHGRLCMKYLTKTLVKCPSEKRPPKSVQLLGRYSQYGQKFRNSFELERLPPDIQHSRHPLQPRCKYPPHLRHPRCQGPL